MASYREFFAHTGSRLAGHIRQLAAATILLLVISPAAQAQSIAAGAAIWYDTTTYFCASCHGGALPGVPGLPQKNAGNQSQASILNAAISNNAGGFMNNFRIAAIEGSNGGAPLTATQRQSLAMFIGSAGGVAESNSHTAVVPYGGSVNITPLNVVVSNTGANTGVVNNLTASSIVGGTLTTNPITTAGANWTYNHTATSCANGSFSYVGNGLSGSTTATKNVTITVTPPAAPTISNSTANIAYNSGASTAIPLTLGGGTATSLIVGALSGGAGTLNAVGTSLTYTASSTNYVASQTVSVQAVGPCATSAAATITINVAAPPAPVITSAATTTGTGGQPFSYNITATNAPTSFGATGLPAWASVNTMTGAITGTPTASGVTNAMISATNATGTTFQALQITVNLVTPVITSSLTSNATSGAPYTYTITANNLPASFSATGLPTGLSINNMTGVISGTPVVAMGGPVNVMISATNTAGTDTRTLVLTVSLNAPTITSANTASGTSGAAFSFQVTATDFPTSYAATGLPTGLSINTMTGLITGTATVAMTTMFPVMITATNGSGSANQTLTITITLPAPAITSSTTASGTVSSPFSYQITASGAPTSYNATGLPTGLSINTANGLISGTPTVNGVSNVMISATNASGTGSQTLTITISNLPAPNAGSFSANVPFNTAATIDLASAVTGSVTGFAIASQPTKGTLTLNGSTVTYTPNAGYFGPDSFTYTASGPGGTSGPGTVTLTVATPGAPTVAARSVTVPFNTAAPIDLTASISGVSTSIAVTAAPLNGTTSINGKVVTYTPKTGYFGEDTFSYTATGPGGTSMPAIVTITVATQAPTAETVNFILPINTPTTMDLAPFIKGSAISGIKVVSEPTRGTAAVNGTKVTYSPNADYFGTDTFTYSAFGNAGVSPAAIVRVTIVGERPNPAKNAEVTGLLTAQADTTRRFAQAQINNFQSRLESLHRSGSIGVAPVPGNELPATPAAAPAPSQGAAGLPARADSGSTGKPGSYLHSSVADASGRGAASIPYAGELIALVTSRSFNVASLIDASADTSSTGSADGAGPPAFWISGIANFGKRQANSQRNELDFSTDGISLGVDRRFNSKFAAGAGVGFARDHTDIGTNGSRSRARGVSVALYGSYHPSANTFVDGLIGAGNLTFKTRRYVAPINDYANAERKGNQYFASLAAGYEFRESGKLLSPYLRLDYTSDRLKQVSETGAGQYALTYFSQTMPSLQGVAGIRAESFNQTNYGWATPRARIELRHEFQKARDSSIAYADLSGGPRFTFSTGAVSRNSLLAGIGADFVRRSGLTIGIDYQVLHNFSHDTAQGIRLNFTQDLDKLGTPNVVRGFFVIPQKPEKIQLDVGYMFDSNVTRAKERPDKRYDRAYSVNVGKGFVFKPFDEREDVRALVTYTLGGEKFQNYDGLSRAMAGVEAEAQYRTSADFDAVTLALFGRLNAESYRSTLRRGYRSSFGFSARQSVTDKIDIFGAIAHNERIGRSGVFNGRDNSVRFNIDYSLSDRETIYATGEFRKGHVVSTGSPSLENLAVADVFVLDDAYPGSLFSYRFDGRTVISTIGYNLGFGPRHSLDMSWRRAQSTPDSRPAFATSPKSYIADQYSIVYLVRF